MREPFRRVFRFFAAVVRNISGAGLPTQEQPLCFQRLFVSLGYTWRGVYAHSWDRQTVYTVLLYDDGRRGRLVLFRS